MIPLALLLPLIAGGAKVASEGYGAVKGRKTAKRKSKEMQRQTYADLLNNALQSQSELQGQGLDTSRKLGTARTRGLLDTAATMRDSFR